MPAGNPLKFYLPVAFVIVVALAALISANPGIVFKLLDPAAALERHKQRSLSALGAADTPLTSEQAEDLFEQFSAGNYRAAAALAQQDARHGLPLDFLRQLEALLIEAGPQHQRAAYLVEQLALQRVFGDEVENALLRAVRTPGGGVNTQPISALGSIGAQRPLSESSLTLLLEVALARSSAERTALAALEKTAAPFGLPDWVLQRLQTIAEQRPGSIRNDAIRVIAVAGDRQRAMAIINTAGHFPVGADAIAAALPADDLPLLLAILRDEAQAMELRRGALDHTVKRRGQSGQVGEALSYAFASDSEQLRLAAINGYSSWGRHHVRHIDIDWRRFCSHAFDDDSDAIRHAIARTFQYIGFDNVQQRDEFLLQMLQGSDRQQLTALGAIPRLTLVSEALKVAALEKAGSGNADIAAAATALAERYRPANPADELSAWLAGSLLWLLLLAPALIAVGFETYFVARLLQNISTGSRRLIAALISIGWFCLSVALGLTLFMGVLGFGHGGHLTAQVYAVLAVINGVFLLAGWLLSLLLRQRRSG